MTRDQQKAMFRLLRHLFFVGREQFESLCRAAFNDPITRWVIDLEAFDIIALDMTTRLKTAMTQTWFCPITDSMQINAFLKLNSLGGHSHRPDWRSLEELGDPAKIREYVTSENIRRLVLLEDFVGSGIQMTSSVSWAAETLPDTPILVIPLVCCPAGSDAGHSLAKRYPNLQFAPVLTLSSHLFLLREPQAEEPAEFERVRELSEQLAHRFGRMFDLPFGFGDTGALVVLYSNCPDNTLPIIHDQGLEWEALFPRIARN